MKSIIIKLSGGFGNQLFQIACARQVSINTQRQLYICEKGDHQTKHLYWDTVLSYFKCNIITIKEFDKLKKSAFHYKWALTRYEYKHINFNSDIECVCIEGYYQSYLYFDLNDFQSYLNLPNVNTIVDNDAVALHIRRGDYLKANFHNILPLDYYYNSLHSIENKISISKIYIFSDDIQWCKANFRYKDIPIIFDHKLNTDIEEFTFLLQFKNIVIANSSFSWWAAYITLKVEEKNVYCPSNWFIDRCHLNTKDLRPNIWNVINDKIKFTTTNVSSITNNTLQPFNQNIRNVISLGSTCCMIQNIHDNLYGKNGPIYHKPENATDFFDWLITDFHFVSFVFENLMFKDTQFLNKSAFTLSDIITAPYRLNGGWKNVYRKVEFMYNEEGSMISLHDLDKNNNEITDEFIDKYTRRFYRLYEKIRTNKEIHFMHCFDFQWLKPYFPTSSEINKIFKSCEIINPSCKITIHFFVHPKYANDKSINEYKYIDNVNICILKDKGFHADWKANNLTFDEFLNMDLKN